MKAKVPRDTWLKPCRYEDKCPFGVQPVVGMWCKVDGIEFWGTDCVCYLSCSKRNWTTRKWHAHRKKVEQLKNGE